MSFDYKITVFTPTYNRAYIIENLYRSIQRQSFRDFEWVVVDDGSADGTEELFAKWQEEGNDFPIRYVKQENGGKCRAINRGMKEARGELFFNIDSDDYLTDDALEKIARWETELPKEGNFCGFSANLGFSPTDTPNRIFEKGYLDGDAFTRYGEADGERAMIFYTDIMRKYPYPEFPGEKFMTEAVTWNRMAWDGLKVRYYNDIIWIYEYKPDGLTNAGYQVFLDNPWGTALFFREKCVFFHYSLKAKLGMWYGFVCDARYKLTGAEIAEAIDMPRWMVTVMKLTDNAVKRYKKSR